GHETFIQQMAKQEVYYKLIYQKIRVRENRKGAKKMIKTKIYGTIGPASYQKDTLVSLINNGMIGIRINLSHGNLNTYQDWIDNIREAEKESGRKISIIADVQGPEIRASLIEEDEIYLKEEEIISIATDSYSLNAQINKGIILNYPQIFRQIRSGQKILIDDGIIQLKVISNKNSSENANKKKETSLIKCKVIQGGKLGNKKSVNFPDLKLDIPSLNDKDRKDIKLAIEIGVNFIMLPFTRTLDDVMILRDYLDSLAAQNIGILAKIENQEGIDNLSTFIEKIDGVIIARGDLGVEIGLTKVPIAQKEIIKLCNKYNKPSIVVTHMLESMIKSPLPSRAEISDIANAVLDGCTGVMLTGETAIGKYPVTAMKYMRDTIYTTENWKRS
ncbi:MAG: pyruvate kinase, partial [Halanaerobiaceae bacterium]